MPYRPTWRIAGFRPVRQAGRMGRRRLRDRHPARPPWFAACGQPERLVLSSARQRCRRGCGSPRLRLPRACDRCRCRRRAPANRSRRVVAWPARWPSTVLMRRAHGAAPPISRMSRPTGGVSRLWPTGSDRQAVRCARRPNRIRSVATLSQRRQQSAGASWSCLPAHLRSRPVPARMPARMPALRTAPRSALILGQTQTKTRVLAGARKQAQARRRQPAARLPGPPALSGNPPDAIARHPVASSRPQPPSGRKCRLPLLRQTDPPRRPAL